MYYMTSYFMPEFGWITIIFEKLSITMSNTLQNNPPSSGPSIVKTGAFLLLWGSCWISHGYSTGSCPGHLHWWFPISASPPNTEKMTTKHMRGCWNERPMSPSFGAACWLWDDLYWREPILLPGLLYQISPGLQIPQQQTGSGQLC